MDSVSLQILNQIGKGYSRCGYRFSDDAQRSRFERSTGRNSGEVILRELIPLFEEAGVTIPYDLKPRSVYKPSMLIDPLVKYLTEVDAYEYDKGILNKATSRVKRAFYVGKLEPLALDDVTYRPDTNAGAPYFLPKGEVSEWAFSEARMIMRGKSPEPLTVFHRGKNDTEVRPVYGYPFAMTLLESRFFMPYQRELMLHASPYVGGKMEGDIAAYINEMRWKSSSILEIDYTGFDGSLSSHLIGRAFDVIQNCFTMNAEEEKCWKIIMRYFVTAPMLLPDGYVIKGRRHGVPSGSMFTQLIDSICNAILVEYVKLRLGIMTSRYYVLGDDCVIGIIGKSPTLEKINWVLSELGVSINSVKSSLTKVQHGGTVHFLGHNRQSFILQRPIEESIRKVLTPERVDLRIFSSDKAVRAEAYVERLRAYQEDNQLAWSSIQRVINLLKRGFPDALPNVEEWIFIPTRVHQERTRFDVGFEQFVRHACGNSLARLALCFGAHRHSSHLI